MREAESQAYSLLRDLDHRNVVKAYDFFPDEQLGPHLVLEYVDGEELPQHVAGLRQEAYTEQAARDLFEQVLEALAYLHGRSVVHRDIKPDNLLVEAATGRVVLIDFNVSRTYNPAVDQPMVESFVVHYSAPEMCDEGTGYDEKVDVWAAGVVLYLLLSGHHPFTAPDDTDETVKTRICTQEPDYSPNRLPGVSDTALDLLQKTLTKDARARPSAAECLSHPWFRQPCASKNNSTTNLVILIDTSSNVRHGSPVDILPLTAAHDSIAKRI